MAAVHDTAVYGVYARENMDSEDDDEDGFGVGDDYVSDDDENEERDRDAAEYFGPLYVSDGRDIED